MAFNSALHPHTYLNRRESRKVARIESSEIDTIPVQHGRDTIIAAVVTSTMLLENWIVRDFMQAAHRETGIGQIHADNGIWEWNSVILISERSRFRGRK